MTLPNSFIISNRFYQSSIRFFKHVSMAKGNKWFLNKNNILAYDFIYSNPQFHNYCYFLIQKEKDEFSVVPAVHNSLWLQLMWQPVWLCSSWLRICKKPQFWFNRTTKTYHGGPLKHNKAFVYSHDWGIRHSTVTIY